MVIRCLEANGEACNEGVTLMGKNIPVCLSPYTIGTVDETGTVLNLMEWEA